MTIEILPPVAQQGAPSGQNGDPSGLLSLVLVARRHGIHLTSGQLMHDHVLTKDEVSPKQIVSFAKAAGLTGAILQLNWRSLAELKKALPAIVRLKNGNFMLLLRTERDQNSSRVVLQDPLAAEDALLLLDQSRFESIWTGETILIKRNYEIADESQPFSLSLLLTLIFRERRMARDIAICAILMSFLALTPIIFWRLLTDRVLYYHAMSTFVALCLFMLMMVAFETAFSSLRRFLVLKMTTRIDVKMATYVFDRVLNLPVEFFERTPAGKTLHDINEVWKVRNFLTGQLFGTVLDGFVLLVFFPVMFMFSPILTAIVFAICAIIFLWILAMLPAYRRKTGAVIAAEAARGSFLVQSIQGIRTVKSLALDARQRQQWDVHVARVEKARFDAGVTANLIQSVVLPFERFAVSGTLAIGVYLAITTKDPVFAGALFAFMMLSQRVVHPLVQFAQLIHQFDEARAAVAVVANLVNQAPEEGRSGNGARTPLEGHVEFANVRFTYRGAHSPALERVTFEAPQGMTLGIMGRSGSGKTTVTRLLQRLHSNYEGLIKIDGMDLRQYDLDHLRGSLGVVLQENFLFSGTIRDNIMAAKPDASHLEVVEAARLAGAEEFIDKLPDGYETVIYEGSPNLSGGQRQRLAIARALITNPRILILDEATSALDAESEAIVNANLKRIAFGRTMIVISHRLSSLVTADAILVLEQGKVHDIGRHEELLGRCDIYSSLWHQQNSHARPQIVPKRGPISAA
jgi:ATP-binding cassette, subfamily B, bacterial HlyB/CyaB